MNYIIKRGFGIFVFDIVKNTSVRNVQRTVFGQSVVGKCEMRTVARTVCESREQCRHRQKAASRSRDGDRGPGRRAGGVRGGEENFQSGPGAGGMGLPDAERVPRPEDQPDDRQSPAAQFRGRDGTRAVRQGLGSGAQRLGMVGLVGAQQGAQRVCRRAQVQFRRRPRAVRPRQRDKHPGQRERRIL